MKKLSVLLFCFFTMLYANYSVAGAISKQGQITELYLNHTGKFARVRFSQPIVNPENCSGEDYYIVELNDTAGSNRFYSSLLAAYMSGKTVEFWISGCTSGTYWSKTRPKLFDIYMK